MRSELLSADGDAAAVAAELRSAVAGGESVAGAVATIIERVRREGDEAVRALTAEHDTGEAPPPPLAVTPAELAAAERSLSPELRDGLRLATRNVTRVARAALRDEQRTVSFDDHTVVLREAPVGRAAVYVPGGRAPYPSTVVMGVATARAAGVKEVAVVSPPGRDGRLAPAILGACALTGADEVYRMGGAQAIAALALGTSSVRPVDVVVGPGNLYVQEAKRQLSGTVGIDSFAGPSDLLVIADGADAPGSRDDPDGANAADSPDALDGTGPIEPVALDLLAQAEHGAGTIVVAISPDRAFLRRLADRLAAGPETAAVCRLVQVADIEEALAVAEAFAPEHLELIGPQAEELAHLVTRAGCVFVGAGSGTAFGDYVAGSNHTLPTGGAARFASALGPQHFRRSFSEVRIADGSALARAAAPIARAEGFETHARSMELRIRENARP